MKNLIQGECILSLALHTSKNSLLTPVKIVNFSLSLFLPLTTSLILTTLLGPGVVAYKANCLST